jgi:lipopolysaccharide/colanic/teichoic acid biosynthesis glycosyltransferase
MKILVMNPPFLKKYARSMRCPAVTKSRTLIYPYWLMYTTGVLKGDMSIVGPRPPILYELEFYDERERKRLFVKPGITGLWQISGRSSTTFSKMIQLDLKYIEDWSIWLDIRIILKTPLAVFRVKDAY